MIKPHKNLTTPGPPFLRNLPSLVAMMITHGNVILHILLKNLMCAHVAKLAFLHIGSGGRPNGKVIITKEIYITIDFAPPPKKKTVPGRKPERFIYLSCENKRKCFLGLLSL